MDDKGKLTPVFKIEEIMKTCAPRLKTLHRYMLYPYQSVQENDSEPPLLVHANILMDMYFLEW